MLPVNRGRAQPRAGMDFTDAKRKPNVLGKVILAVVLTVFCVFILKQCTNMFAVHELGVTHVLVTGGAGFIGSHAALRLLKDNYRVTIVDNLSRGARW